MVSARKLARLRREEEAHPEKLTVFVVGYTDGIHEPLMLEALANHPAVGKLYFVPIDKNGERNRKRIQTEIRDLFDRHDENGNGDRMDMMGMLHGKGKSLSHRPVPLDAYDITEVLARQGAVPPNSAQVEASLKAYFRDTRHRIKLRSDRADFLISGHHDHALDMYLPLKHPKMANLNHAGMKFFYDQKTVLPALAEEIREITGVGVVPACATVGDAGEAAQFMQAGGFDQIVLKQPSNMGGHGVYRVFRDHGALMVEVPELKNTNRGDATPGIYPLEDFPFPGPLLAMEWLDPSKGDMRAVVAFGQCVGAYKRMPPEDSWLCNHAQGGRIEPVDLRRDLSRADRQRLNAVARGLHQLGINHASVDLLANHRGERMLSEVNIGYTDDFVEIDLHHSPQQTAFGRLPVPDQMAGRIVEAFRILQADRLAEKEMRASAHAARR